VNDLQVDETILSVAKASWRKVAFVIFKVADTMGSHLPEGEAGYNLVAKRIEILVRGGRLLAQGDIKKWRHSEVRKPDLAKFNGPQRGHESFRTGRATYCPSPTDV